MNYEEVARDIVKEAINSAIFIDENAKEPYSQVETPEAERCVELYNTFKDNGISLSIYQYNDSTYKNSMPFLFSNRDLVLLDWKLQGDDGTGEKSLDILSEIVNNQQHIHFCVIYTSESNKDSVFNNILSFFSGGCKDEYVSLKESLAEDQDEILEIEDLLLRLLVYRFDKAKSKEVKGILKKGSLPLVEKIQEVSGEEECTALIKCGIAFANFITSKSKETIPSSIDIDSYTLNINNTIIVILNKDEIKPDEVFNKFAENIAKYKWGVMQLLGLEMRNIIKTKEAFVSKNVLQVTQEALGYHKGIHTDDFEAFLKSVMLEQELSTLRSEKLSLVEAIEIADYNEKLNEEYVSMNIFYNSAYIDGDKKLSFGDVFKCEENYYMCITALCDCARPENRDNIFYFAKGEAVKKDTALTIGDEGFISYIGPDEFVKWSTHTDKKDANPTYIIPLPYFVLNSTIQGGNLTIKRFKLVDGQQGDVEESTFVYKTTIKQNYAQRIANHAFTHPVRVGIDFVKKPKK